MTAHLVRLALPLTLALALGAPALADKAEPTALELLNGTDDLYRGSSSIAVVEMNVKTKRWTRQLELHVWTKGEEKSLIRIAQPKKEAGVTTLKVGKNVWNYLPKVDRVMKVPSSMMSGSWMGSHFSNDDLVRDSRFENAYTFTITERPADGKDRYVVEAIPKPKAPVVWGKVVVIIDGKTRLPLEQLFYDEKGRLMRKMTYSDIRDAGGGRMVPMRMRLEPGNKPGEYTEIHQRKLKLDVDIPDEKFSIQALKR
jgi:outer membrane lipoprotein-sorting protein